MKLVVRILRKLITIFLLLLLLLPLFAAPQHAYAQTGTVVRVDPASLTVDPGQSFSIDIVIEGVIDLYGFDISVQYDPDYLNVDSVELGLFLEQGLLIPPEIDEHAGIVKFGNTQINPQDSKSGSGILFTIYFTAQSLEGNTPLEILDTDDLTVLTDINGTEIPCTVQPGALTIGNAPEEPFYSFLPLIMQ